MNSKTVLFFSAVRWSGIYQRNHHIAKRLAKNNTVYFVEPTFSILALRRNDNLKYWRESFAPVKRIDENLIIIPGPLVLPFRNLSLTINNINEWLLRRWLKKRVSTTDIDILWVTAPNQYKQIGQWNERLSCYDCYDEHTEWQGAVSKSKVQEMEAQLFKKADLVFASAGLLVDKARQYRSEVVYMPNAVDEGVFEASTINVEFEPLLDSALRGGRKVVGFVGSLAEWLDYEMIAESIESLPDALFVFVGPKDCPQANRLEASSNVLITGKKEFSLIPAYISTFDVCTIPFKVNKLTQRVSPIKVYEYLAQGKPVVSVDLPEMAQMSDMISIVKDKRQYSDSIATVLMEASDESAAQRRIQFARDNTWGKRVSLIELRLDELLEKDKN